MQWSRPTVAGGATKRDAEDHAFIPGIPPAGMTVPPGMAVRGAEKSARVHKGTGKGAAATDMEPESHDWEEQQ